MRCAMFLWVYEFKFASFNIYFTVVAVSRFAGFVVGVAYFAAVGADSIDERILFAVDEGVDESESFAGGFAFLPEHVTGC